MKLSVKSSRLGEDSIKSLLIQLSIPSIIGMATQALYNVVDSIYVGHISKEALSALSISFPIQMILISVGVGTGVGVTSLISRLLGERDESRADNVAEHALIIIFFLGTIVGFIGYLFSNDIIMFFTGEPILIDLASKYTRIILIGSVAMFFPMIVNNILRGEGNTFAPMLTLIISAVLNIVIDPFLIFGIGFFPELGVEGAAYATVFSRLVGGVFIAFILFSGDNQIRIKLEDFKFDFSIIRDIYQVGFPVLIMQLLASFMVAGVNLIVVTYSLTAVAVMGIYFRLQSFVFMPIFGLSQGYMPILGYNYGHRNPIRMKKSIKYSLIVGFVFSTLGFVIFQLFPSELILLFNDDPQLVMIGQNALRKISLAFPIIGPAIVMSTTFQAIGKGVPSLVVNFLRQMVLLLPIMYFFGIFYGLEDLWYAFPISEILTFVITVLWLKFTFNKVFKELDEDKKFIKSRENL